jgi:proliferating cell nuclear antigen
MSAAAEAEAGATTDAWDATVEASTFAALVDGVSVLVDECKIHLDEDGVRIRAVDRANIGMVDLELDAAAFDSYEHAEGDVLGVNLSRFEDIVGLADNGDLVHLDLNPETRKLHIAFAGLEYTLALIDPDSILQEPDIPELDLPAEVVCEGSDLDRAVRAADMVSDHVALGVDAADEVFYAAAEGDTDDVHLRLDDDLVDLTAGAAHSLFSLNYLKDIAKAVPADAEVTLDLGEEFPVKLHQTVADGHLDATYMVAPRIQSG